MNKQLDKDIVLRRSVKILLESLDRYIVSPLGAVPKPNSDIRRIFNLSWPRGKSVNSFISEEIATFKYTEFEEVLQIVVKAGRGYILFKRDMKDTFRLIPFAPSQY